MTGESIKWIFFLFFGHPLYKQIQAIDICHDNEHICWLHQAPGDRPCDLQEQRAAEGGEIWSSPLGMVTLGLMKIRPSVLPKTNIWVCLKMGYTPNEIAIFHRDNDH